MRVLLLQVNVMDRRHQLLNPRVYPLGLSYVATALEQHDVTIFDPSVEESPSVAIREEVAGKDPDVVGLSLRHVFPSPKIVIEECRELTKQIRSARKAQLKIVIGGPGFSVRARAIMEQIPELDYGVIYEGEETLPELLGNLGHPQTTKGILFREGAEVVFTGERERLDVNKMGMPRRDLIDLRPYLERPYLVGVQSKRGCILKCAYCAYPNLDGTTLRLRDPEKVVDEIELLADSYNVGSLTFVDNVFNIPESHARQICEEIMRRKLRLRWTAWFHEAHITREFLELAKEAGCDKFEFSPDGFSDKTLRSLGKSMTKKDIIDCYKNMKRIQGVGVQYHFFFWPPDQDILAFLRMLWFKLRLKLRFGRLARINFGTICIVPGTKLQQMAMERGIIQEDTDLYSSAVEYWSSAWICRLFKMKRAWGRTRDCIIGGLRRCIRKNVK